jgi:lipopolysaccharide transport system ATP-binding protein
VTESAIIVSNLSKSFQMHQERRNSIKELFVRGAGRSTEFPALHDVSFEVPRGTTFGLVGSNGSGKSTLLKMLAGVYRPTSGSVTVNGHVSALLELGAGFHGELTGRENVYLNGAILGMSRKQIDAAMDQIIDFAGIEEFIDAPVKVYSSGMYVRLGFSIAVTVDPEILIVDEIIAVGDEEFQRKCFDHLFELRKKGTTIVLVSHSLGLVGDLCDGAVWLDKGRLRTVGKARDVIDDYLGAVNAKEAAKDAEAHSEAQTSDDSAARPRLGSGEVRVTGIEFLDASGRPGSAITTGEPCTVRMHYHAQAAIPEATFGLGFVHESGVTVAGPNSTQRGKPFTLARGEGYVDFYSQSAPLQPGTFSVSTAIVDHGHMYDYLDRRYELRVRSHTASTEGGLARWVGAWSASNEDVDTTAGTSKGAQL